MGCSEDDARASARPATLQGSGRGRPASGAGGGATAVATWVQLVAAHLVDRVWPEVPVRQWVLTLPHSVRWLCACDQTVCRGVDGGPVAPLTAPASAGRLALLWVNESRSGSGPRSRWWTP